MEKFLPLDGILLKTFSGFLLSMFRERKMLPFAEDNAKNPYLVCHDDQNLMCIFVLDLHKDQVEFEDTGMTFDYFIKQVQENFDEENPPANK